VDEMTDIERVTQIYELEKRIQDEKSEVYDELFFQSIVQIYLRKVVATFISSNFEVTSRILDFGCGTGFLLSLLEQQGFTYLSGVDISEGMINKARNTLKETYLACGEDALDKFSLACCDVVVSTEVLHHLPDLKRIFERVAQVLRMGGSFVFLEPMSDWMFEGGYNSSLSIFLPLFLTQRVVGRKNRKKLLKLHSMEQADSFNPCHRHLSLDEIMKAMPKSMKLTDTRRITTSLCLFQASLFNDSFMDRCLFKILGTFDRLLLDRLGKGRYLFCVARKRSDSDIGD